jgi:hypothetical protein
LEAVTAALQAYSDRGVFRGFQATPAARARVTYQFAWLTRRPVDAVFNPRTNTLTFPALLPALGKAAAADVAAVIGSLARRDTPTHKRLDARRARITGAVRRGAFTLSIGIRGANHEYAVKAALNLINEIFVMLQECHPDYLIEQFGMSTE